MQLNDAAEEVGLETNSIMNHPKDELLALKTAPILVS